MKFTEFTLSPKELWPILRYKDSMGKRWVEESILEGRARKWVELNLEVIEEERFAYPEEKYQNQRYRDTYKRKDSAPITQDDIDALKELHYGMYERKNVVIGNVDDLKVFHEWIRGDDGSGRYE